MSEFYLRKVEKQDIDLLYNWVCDPEVRRKSLNTNPITYIEHLSWFLKKISADETVIYIYCYNNIPVGQIRIEIDGHIASINYSIDKKYRGKGHGKRILLLLEEKLCSEYKNIKKLTAIVKIDNIASNKKFEQLGYSKTELQGVILYNKDLLC